jgi:D-hexose-6-phosphate mutarotase
MESTKHSFRRKEADYHGYAEEFKWAMYNRCHTKQCRMAVMALFAEDTEAYLRKIVTNEIGKTIPLRKRKNTPRRECL